MFIQEIYFCSILFVQSVSETIYLSAEPLLLLEDMALNPSDSLDNPTS